MALGDAKDRLAHGAHLTNGNRQQKLSRLAQSNGRGPNAKNLGVKKLLGHPVNTQIVPRQNGYVEHRLKRVLCGTE